MIVEALLESRTKVLEQCELKRIGRTLQSARSNFVTSGAALVSANAYLRTTQSESQEAEALRFLEEWHTNPDGGDEFFLGELGRMRRAREQLDADLDYADWIIERNRAVLQSGTEFLHISGQRELGEISHHLGIDSAAVVATLLALSSWRD